MSVVTVDGKEYALVESSEWQIIVCQRGFVFYGRVVDKENEVVIHDAQNIRRWGTTRGLGQLAADGPTENTVLDPSGTVRVHPLTVVVRYDCPNRWARV